MQIVEIGDMEANRSAAGSMDFCSQKPQAGAWAAIGTSGTAHKRKSCLRSLKAGPYFICYLPQKEESTQAD